MTSVISSHLSSPQQRPLHLYQCLQYDDVSVSRREHFSSTSNTCYAGTRHVVFKRRVTASPHVCVYAYRKPIQGRIQGPVRSPQPTLGLRPSVAPPTAPTAPTEVLISLGPNPCMVSQFNFRKKEASCETICVEVKLGLHCVRVCVCVCMYVCVHVCV